MVYRTLIQASLCLLTLSVWSQNANSYKGNFLNYDDEELAGVQVLTFDNEVISVSDENGYFNIGSDRDSLLAKHLGYNDKVLFPSNMAQDIKLSEASSLLNAIVVSENKRANSIKNSTISIEMISPDLISNTAPTNLEESIGRINGVQVVDNQPTIRSGSGWSYGAGSRVQVLVDGVPLLSGDAGQPLWTFAPTEGIEAVEIIKGASSVIYGSSALNGVINIKTKKPSKKPYTQVTTSCGIYDLPQRKSLHYRGNNRNSLSNFTAYHSRQIKGVGVTLGLNWLNDQSYKTSDYDKRIRARLGLRKVVSKKNLVFGLNTTYQKGKSGSFLLWESLEKGYIVLDSIPTDNIVNRLTIDPYVSWVKGNFNHSLNTRWLSIDNFVDNGDTSTNQSNQSNLLYSEYQVKHMLKVCKINLIGGIVATQTISKSPLYSGVQRAKKFAGYVQLDKKWNRLTAAGGARLEKFILNSREEAKPVFRAGLNYKAAAFTYLRTSYGQGYRFPSIAESYISTSVGPLTIFPNENLKSETGINIEFGVKQGLKIKELQLMVDIAAFQMDYNNMLEFTFGQWGPLVPPYYGGGFKTLNTNKARVKGVEANVSFQKKVSDLTVQGFMGYTYSKSEALEPYKTIGMNSSNINYINSSFDTTDFALKYRPKHLAKADVMLSYKKWTLGIGAAYQSKIQNIDLAFTTFPIGLEVPGIEEAMSQELTKYILINSRLSYSFAKSWKTNLIVSNLANREYEIRPADLGAPRSFRLQVTYTIDNAK